MSLESCSSSSRVSDSCETDLECTEDGVLNWALCNSFLSYAQTARGDPYGTSRNRTERLWRRGREVDLST